MAYVASVDGAARRWRQCCTGLTACAVCPDMRHLACQTQQLSSMYVAAPLRGCVLPCGTTASAMPQWTDEYVVLGRMNPFSAVAEAFACGLQLWTVGSSGVWVDSNCKDTPST
jgi:hypothetical protein